MLLIATVLTAVVIAIHVYIVLIETVLFRTRGRKVFGIKEDRVDALQARCPAFGTRRDCRRQR